MQLDKNCNIFWKFLAIKLALAVKSIKDLIAFNGFFGQICLSKFLFDLVIRNFQFPSGLNHFKRFIAQRETLCRVWR
jgi:hypothetical protein